MAVADTLGRSCRTLSFAGASVPNAGDCTTTPASSVVANTSLTYNMAAEGRRVSQTDPLKATRHLYYDGAERLRAVVEAPSSAGYVTNYSYDGRGNLVEAKQSGTCTASPITACPTSLLRTFTYDSRGHLLTATNPESGGITHTYDNNGNLHQRTDARGVVTTYGYDTLDRLTSKTYSPVPLATTPPSTYQTPAVYYQYNSEDANGLKDAAGNTVACAAGTSYPKTRLTRIQTAEATRYLNCFDALGRPGRSQQKLATGEVDNFTYGDSVTYGYAANGAVRLVTYPAPAATAGRTVTTTYDDAGRVSTVQG